MSQSGSAGGTTTTDDQRKTKRGVWCLKHKCWHTALCVLTAATTGFLIWWVAAEAITSDGTKVWGTSWTFILAAVVVGAGVAGAWVSCKYRDWKKNRGGDDLPLLGLVVGGILVSVVLAFALAYAQAELLTGPGESVTALEPNDLFDIARATTFALGAFGAVAVLLVNYRKQRSVEAALRQDQAKHLSELASENRKQRASEIAALHDRYTKAVEQLANKENPAIRLGGVHALAALAEDWAEQGIYAQRQVCVDLVCSYLRNVPRGETTREYNGECSSWSYDIDYLEEDRDARKAALEWLSRLAADDAEAPSADADADASQVPALEIDLRGVVLHTLDLRSAKLRHLKMPGAGLGHTNLSNADLAHTDLTGAVMFRATLEDTVLNDAILQGAKLERAGLTNAHLVRADLRGAHLQEAKLVKADLTDAKLRGAQVDEGTSFIGATLDDADFYGVNVQRLDLGGVDYSKAKNFELHDAQAGSVKLTV